MEHAANQHAHDHQRPQQAYTRKQTTTTPSDTLAVYLWSFALARSRCASVEKSARSDLVSSKWPVPLVCCPISSIARILTGGGAGGGDDIMFSLWVSPSFSTFDDNAADDGGSNHEGYNASPDRYGHELISLPSFTAHSTSTGPSLA